MKFIFQIEKVSAIPGSNLCVLDGQLLEGAIAHGVKCRTMGAPEFEIVIKHVGLVSPSREKNKRSLSIDPPPCRLEDLIGCNLTNQ